LPTKERLTKEECLRLRAKPIYADDKHFVMRYMYRAAFQKVRAAILEGDIYREGKDKYRAVLPMKDKVLFVIFKDKGDYIEPMTVGVTSRKSKRWG
ncbi:MAG: hypothetical protein AB1779_02440, partial [Candidatus Thermoplasmatota archaeon]